MSDDNPERPHPSRYNGLPVASVNYTKTMTDPSQAFRATLTFRDADGRDIGRVSDLGPAQVGAAIGSVNTTRISRGEASGSLERETLTEFHGMGPSVEHARTDGPGRGGSVEPRATERESRSTEVEPDPVRRARHDREAEVLTRFDRVGRELRFRDGRRETAVSNLDDDRRISTPSDDPRAVRAVVEIAAVRGWTAIQIKRDSSDAFKREAWIEARARGLETRGYRPNESDREALRTRAAELGTAYREQEETRRTLLDRAIDRIARSHTRTDSAASRLAERLREGLQTRADEGRVPKGDPEQAIRRAPEHDRTPVRQPEPDISR